MDWASVAQSADSNDKTLKLWDLRGGKVRGAAYFGARLARIRCRVRRCMLRRRAVSETLRPQSS